MSRRRDRRSAAARPLSPGLPRAEIKADGRWIVRPMAGATAGKSYRCPGCEVLIPPGTAHIVAWPDTPPLGSERAVDERRHWHSACWRRRP